MSWPMSQDYNEAIQSPTTSFADPELKQGEAVCNALGLPVPCSGNFADVYAVQSGSRKWAVKCFTREIPGLQERYVQISSYLKQVNLPFMVEFSFLPQGIRVRGQWFPVLKMQWVEGVTLNAFVRDNLDKPAPPADALSAATRGRQATPASTTADPGFGELVHRPTPKKKSSRRLLLTGVVASVGLGIAVAVAALLGVTGREAPTRHEPLAEARATPHRSTAGSTLTRPGTPPGPVTTPRIDPRPDQ